MVSKIILAIFLGTFFHPLIEWIRPLSEPLHHYCLGSTPQKSEFRSLYQAIVCGKKNIDPSLKSLFRQFGIIHILVVSGAHLLYLRKLLEIVTKGRIPPSISFLFILFFVMTTQFQITAFRAWLYLVLAHIDKKKYLHSSRSLLIMLSIVICLIISPQQYDSLSLQLSWLAALALTQTHSNYKQSLLCYLFLCPMLLILGLPSFWTILINIILTPVIGLFLFPICMMTVFLPFLSPISDGAWFLVISFMDTFQTSMPAPASPASIFKWKLPLWLFCLSLNLVLIKHEGRKRV